MTFQVVSVVLSFLSVLQTLIQFNEWSKRRHTLHRLVLVVPFFAVTIIYRVTSMSLIIAFGGHLALLPIFGLLMTQVNMGYLMKYSVLFARTSYSQCNQSSISSFSLKLSLSSITGHLYLRQMLNDTYRSIPRYE